MDAADVRIFCEMAFSNSGFDPNAKRQASSGDIGKKLGLDEKTVRTRIKNMDSSGFIKYYQAVPNPALFGLRSVGSFRFEALNLATKMSVVEKMNSVPRLVDGFDYLGRSVGATFAGKTQEDVTTSAETLARRFELGVTGLGGWTAKAPTGKLDRADWLIMRELRYDARAHAATIARKLDLTPRMVEYRASKLTSSGAVVVHAVIDVRRQAGVVFFDLQISTDETKRTAVVRMITEKHGTNLWSMSTPTSATVVARFFGFSLGEPEELALNMQMMDGVKTVFPFVLKEAIEPSKPNWIDKLIDEAIDQEKS